MYGRLQMIAIVVAVLGLSGQVPAQIKPYSANAWYWQYHGKPVFLFGGSNLDNMFQLAGRGALLTERLDLLKSCGGNYLRCTMSSRSYKDGGYRWDLLPYPFAQVDGKYDLRKWNDVYWNKLRTFLRETKRRSIFVQLEFWDRWNESGNSDKAQFGWYWSPWNPNNNVTYDWSDSPLLKPGKTDFYNAFHLAAVTGDPVLLPLQQRFVKKILDEVIDGGFDHVLFQVDNESGIGDDTLQPDPYWAQFARDYARSKGDGHEIYICTSRRFHPPTPYKATRFQDWSNPEIRVPIVNPAFNYCDISQNNGTWGQTHYDNILWYRDKVRAHGIRPINNVKCYHFNWAIGAAWNAHTVATDAEAGAKFWRAVFAGCASIRFHRDTGVRPHGKRPGFGLEPEARVHIRSMRLLIDAIDIFSMEPRDDLLSDRASNEAYCLAEPGKQFAVFFTGEGDRSVAIDLTSADGALSIRWLDVAQSRWQQPARLQAGKACTLSAPAEGHWVALIRKGG